jgi:hypothetical protein
MGKKSGPRIRFAGRFGNGNGAYLRYVRYKFHREQLHRKVVKH